MSGRKRDCHRGCRRILGFCRRRLHVRGCGCCLSRGGGCGHIRSCSCFRGCGSGSVLFCCNCRGRIRCCRRGRGLYYVCVPDLGRGRGWLLWLWPWWSSWSWL